MYKHPGFMSSSGINGWYETVEEDEVIEFEYTVNSLIIESSDEPLAIKINSIDDIWHLSADDKEGIEGLTIKKIQVLNPAGTRIRWKALLV